MSVNESVKPGNPIEIAQMSKENSSAIARSAINSTCLRMCCRQGRDLTMQL